MFQFCVPAFSGLVPMSFNSQNFSFISDITVLKYSNQDDLLWLCSHQLEERGSQLSSLSPHSYPAILQYTYVHMTVFKIVKNVMKQAVLWISKSPTFFWYHMDLFGPKRDEVTGNWRKLHNEEIHNLYPSPSIIRMIKSRRMRWAACSMNGE
jgi:hypothetical protein